MAIRREAVKLADALNKIEGAPVSEHAKQLSEQWAKGEITSEEMISIIVKKHYRPVGVANE